MATSTLQHVTTHSRASGHSAVAGAAYRLGVELVDERTGLTHNYEGKGGVLETLHHLPAHADPSYADPGVFWNAVEAKERRGDARLARDFRQSVPLGLDQEQAAGMMKEYTAWLSERYDTPVTAALHRDNAIDAFGQDKTAEQQGYHIHAFMPDRALGEDGLLGPKLRDLGNPKTSWKEIEACREQWGTLCNEYAIKHQLGKEFDHRSHVRRGDGIEAEQTLGVVATAMERRGEKTDRGNTIRAQREDRAILAQTQAPEPTQPQPDKTPDPAATKEAEARQLREFLQETMDGQARIEAISLGLQNERKRSTIPDLKAKVEHAQKQQTIWAGIEAARTREAQTHDHKATTERTNEAEQRERGRRAMPFFQGRRRREAFAAATRHSEQAKHHEAEATARREDAGKAKNSREGWGKTEAVEQQRHDQEAKRMQRLEQDAAAKIKTEERALVERFKALSPTNRQTIEDLAAKQRAEAERARIEAERKAEMARQAEQAKQQQQRQHFRTRGREISL
ncbi:TPA: MobA/MobL family protein [Burkholderia vietnamiensis]|nr:MobA/MobL family protein [Burkholderia vietnamiensis]HDR9172669.1 MobA/MobL family protein [Burkholderia vietnamiensis]